MKAQVFETRLIHLCSGVDQRLWHIILTEVLLKGAGFIDGAELSICSAMCGKPLKWEMWFGLVHMTLIYKRQGVLAGSVLKSVAF